MGIFVIAVALIGTSAAFAEVTSVKSETVQWVTGEEIYRATVFGLCGEKAETIMQFTYFDDYVHVLTIEDGEYDLQRQFSYEAFVTVSNDLYHEVVFC